MYGGVHPSNTGNANPMHGRQISSCSVDDPSKFPRTRVLSTALRKSPSRNETPCQVRRPSTLNHPNCIIQKNSRHHPSSALTKASTATNRRHPPTRADRMALPDDSVIVGTVRSVVIADGWGDCTPRARTRATARTSTTAVSPLKNATDKTQHLSSLSNHAMARSLRKSRIERASKTASESAPHLPRASLTVRSSTVLMDHPYGRIKIAPMISSAVRTHDTYRTLMPLDESKKLPTPHAPRQSKFHGTHMVPTPIPVEVSSPRKGDAPTTAAGEEHRTNGSLSDADIVADRPTTRGPPVCITVKTVPRVSTKRRKQPYYDGLYPEHPIQKMAHTFARAADEDELQLNLIDSIAFDKKWDDDDDEEEDVSAPTLIHSRNSCATGDSSMSTSDADESEISSQSGATGTIAEDFDSSTGFVDNEKADVGILSRTVNMFVGNSSMREWGIGCQFLMCTSTEETSPTVRNK